MPSSDSTTTATKDVSRHKNNNKGKPKTAAVNNHTHVQRQLQALQSTISMNGCSVTINLGGGNAPQQRQRRGHGDRYWQKRAVYQKKRLEKEQNKDHNKVSSVPTARKEAPK